MFSQRIEAMREEIKMLDIIEIAREKGIEEGSLGADREMIPDLLFDRFGIVALYIQEEIEKTT